jgi:hypothetical protein
MRLGEIHICNNPLLYFSNYVGSYKASTGNTFGIITVEVKPPKKSSEVQLGSDFVKVGKVMKGMIDVLVNLGIETLTVDDVLLEGFPMTTYTM